MIYQYFDTSFWLIFKLQILTKAKKNQTPKVALSSGTVTFKKELSQNYIDRTIDKFFIRINVFKDSQMSYWHFDIKNYQK